VKIYSIKKEQ